VCVTLSVCARDTQYLPTKIHIKKPVVSNMERFLCVCGTLACLEVLWRCEC
jgi:hypothetical protein